MNPDNLNPGQPRPAENEEPDREKSEPELQEELQRMLSWPVELLLAGPAADAGVSRVGRPRILLDSYGALLRHENPPLQLLQSVKDFAKCHLQGWQHSAYPWPIARFLYLACTAKALVRWNILITHLDRRSLLGGLEWCAAQKWVPEDLRQLCCDAIGRLKAMPGDLDPLPRNGA